MTRSLALAIHDRQLAEHGGSDGVRDDNLLESALARPQQLFAYGDPAPDLADLAASLAYGLARNHPFVDGNKRTAAVACETFLELNGVTLEAEDLELFPIYLALAEGKLAEKELANWLRAHLRTVPITQVHEPRTPYGDRRRGPRPVGKRAGRGR
jgi:death-on-curing protein